MTKAFQYHNLIIYMIIYFFLNSFLLPQGLLYTTILTPVMLYFLFKEKKLRLLNIWILAFIVPIPFQVLSGVEMQSFVVSNIMIFTAFVFFFTSIIIVRTFNKAFDSLFRTLLLINSILVVVAILIFPFEGIRGLFWYDIAFTKGVELIPRLKLFTYEASYYSLIMMPVFLYFILRVFYNKERHPMLIFLASTIPLLFSLSFGVLGAMLIGFIVVVIIKWRLVPKTLQQVTLYGGFSLIALTILLLIVWPDNPIYFRLINIFEGKDTSAMGRLIYSFMFAKDIIIQHGILFGIGPGQVKIIAHDMIVNHYKYHGTLGEVVRIPNSMAEMLAIYGVYGFIFKLFMEIYFFVKKRTYINTYSLMLFLFIFIYQFTGSFISNVAELGIWAIVFCARFPDFDNISLNKKSNAI